jgi:hypothetical protein
MSPLLKGDFTSEKQLIYIWFAGIQKCKAILKVCLYRELAENEQDDVLLMLIKRWFRLPVYGIDSLFTHYLT